MWKRKEDEIPVTPLKPSPAGYNPGNAEASRITELLAKGIAYIGKSVVLQGQLSASEDIYVDGQLEGTVELRGHNLIVGPNGRLRTSIHARGVVIEGKVDGDVRASERVELRKSAILVGDIVTQRISIEDGAYFHGRVEVQTAKPKAAVETKAEPAHSVAAASGLSAASSDRSAVAGPAPAISGQQKKS